MTMCTVYCSYAIFKCKLNIADLHQSSKTISSFLRHTKQQDLETCIYSSMGKDNGPGKDASMEEVFVGNMILLLDPFLLKHHFNWCHYDLRIKIPKRHSKNNIIT